MTPARRVILDTDPGIDDALAILLAVASPEVELAAVTVTGGNCPLDQGVRNALGVLETVRSAVPVVPGVALPLIRPPFTAPETHGNSGLGNAQLPPPTTPPAQDHAVDLLVREIMTAREPVTLVAVGPLTNVALAIRRQPQIVERVHQVIVMGGAIDVPGNTTPLAEFNVYVDPHAAHIVLHSGLPLTLLPWDITSQVLLTQAHVDALLTIASPVTRLIADATSFYIDFHREYFGYAGCSINDPIALALVFQPELAHYAEVFVDVEIDSPKSIGKTIADAQGLWKRSPNVRLVTGFDAHAFLELFTARMAALAREHPARS
ncbi:MAG: nucleoside hydrolase [Chloroflexi bacterium]|nr:MAG: nucleoside hydrolase [Chloroflexota bacterium]